MNLAKVTRPTGQTSLILSRTLANSMDSMNTQAPQTIQEMQAETLRLVTAESLRLAQAEARAANSITGSPWFQVVVPFVTMVFGVCVGVVIAKFL